MKRTHVECKRCGFVWKKTVEKPRRCRRCGSIKYEIESDITPNSKEKILSLYGDDLSYLKGLISLPDRLFEIVNIYRCAKCLTLTGKKIGRTKESVRQSIANACRILQSQENLKKLESLKILIGKKEEANEIRKIIENQRVKWMTDRQIILKTQK